MDFSKLTTGQKIALGAGAVVLAMKAFSDNAVTMGNLRTEQIALVLAAVGTLFIILRWLTETSLTKFGLFLGIIAAGAVTYGASQTMKEAGLSMPSADDFKSIAGKDDAADA